MILLRQSTAVTEKLGPFVNDGDGVTPETGLTIAQGDILLSKNGGSLTQTHNAAGAPHDAIGYYGAPFDTTDTDTLGRLKVAIYVGGALHVWDNYMVITQQAWDSLCAADKLQVHVVEMTADVVDAAAVKADAVTEIQSGLAVPGDAMNLAADAVDAAALKADAVTAIQSGLALAAALATAQSDLDKLTGTDGATLASSQGNYAPAKAGDAMNLAGDAVSAAALKTDAVTEIVTAVFAKTGLTAVGAVTFANMVKAFYSVLRGGKIVKDGNDYKFYDDDNATLLFTWTIAAGGRTTS